MNQLQDRKEKIRLTEEQWQIIDDLANNLSIMADLSQADMFIDCLLEEGDGAVVVAEANPNTTQSLYKSSAVGKIAHKNAEPGVIFSLTTGKPVIGSRGITQENIVMQQDIVPIKDASEQTIAVLIKEQDISQKFEAEQRVKTFMHSADNREKDRLRQTIIVQEIHHRVKNNLQVIASLLRLQMRRSSSDEVISVFKDSVSRISSMSVVHDYLAQRGIEEADVKFVMEQISALLVSASSDKDKKIAVSVQGDPLFLPSDKASSVALIVNELVQNCIKHAFASKKTGSIDISVHSHKQMAFITVADNGQGITENRSTSKKSSLGLQLVKMLAEEELQGELACFHSNKGTTVSLTFPITDQVRIK